ncbi:hypothetical protein GTA28_23710 [Rhodococcus hoagii]|nr:hypothetical protein [Prescottella equi]MBM4654071.1 hypothetical protein [Prescottella equi]NKR23344.1 hypothetical protein [Prescottella equi]NKZ79796.1 hypothetical protein [Prescottella equi]
MTDDHRALWQSESAACEPTVWEQWISAVETGLGHSADGDQGADGYSLDAFYAMWQRGASVQEAIASTTTTPR